MVTLNLYTVDWRSWQSVLIALVTRSIYTHAAIQVGEQIFEASGHRANIGWAHASTYDGRDSRKIPIAISAGIAAKILSRYEGKKYDYRALRWWFFSFESKNKYYCFELCWEFLRSVGALKTDQYISKKITAHTLLNSLDV